MKKFCLLLIACAAAAALVLGMPLNTLLAADFQYVGDTKCKMCHSKDTLGGAEFPAWEKTAHAKAFESLKPGAKADAKTKAKLDPQKDYSTDAACLKCHNTGYGKPSAADAKLEGVQCEACHGPGSEYKSPKIMGKKKYQDNKEAAHKDALAAGLVMPTEELCKGCHNQESPTFKEFDYKKMVEMVKHKK